MTETDTDYLHPGRSPNVVSEEAPAEYKVDTGVGSINSDIKDRILSAVETLALEGNSNPTNREIRAVCKASFSHISPVMREWRESQKKEQLPPMPDSVSIVGDKATALIWNAAIKFADERFDTERDRINAAITEIEAERDEAFLENDRLESKISNQDDIITQLESKLRVAESQVSELIAKHDESTSKINSLASEVRIKKALLEEKTQQVTEKKAEILEMKSTIKDMQNTLSDMAKKGGS